MNFFLYLAAFSVPFYFWRFSILGIPTNFFEIMVLLAAFLAIIKKWFGRKSGSKVKWGGAWPYLFVLSAAVAVVLANDKTAALGILKGWFIIPVIYWWSVINTIDRKDFPKLSLALFAAVLIISVWAIGQKFGLWSTLFYQVGDNSFDQYLDPAHFRAFGPFESPNYLAMFLLPATLLSLPALVLLHGFVSKVLISLLFIFPLLALFFSASRGGIITLAVVLVWAVCLFSIKGYLTERTKRVEKIVLGGLDSIAKVGAVAGLALFLVKVALSSPLNRPILGGDFSRVEIYSQSLKLLKSNFVAGIGLGQFNQRIDAATEGMTSFRQYLLPYALHPHNLYLALWLNLGLLGIILFILVLISFIRSLKITAGLVRLAAILSMVAILTHGLVDTTYFKNDLSALFWLTYAIGFLPKTNK